MTNVIELFGKKPAAATLSPLTDSIVNNTIETGRANLLDSLHSQGAFYDVECTANLFPVTEGDKTAYRSTGKKTLINGTTKQPISVMSDAYTVVQNKDIFNALDRQIAESDLDLTGAYTKVDVANNGAQVAVRYIFPAHSVDTGNGDTTSLMITAINSFNGSTSFCIYLGGFRGYCMNTQVFGTTIVQYKKQHSRGLSIDRAAEIIRGGIDVFNMEGEIWKKMAQTTVTDQDAYLALAEMAEIDVCLYPTYRKYQREVIDAQTRTTKMENYVRIYRKYAQEMGSSEFALYNTLTHISTHGAAQSGNRDQAISTFSDRTNKVKRIAYNHLTSYAA